MKHLLISAALSIGLATSAVATTLTDKFSSFLVLGDSLSDNGNLFKATTDLGLPPTPGAPYVNGRFSDGEVWNEGILAEFAAAGKFSKNFAFGGAETVNGTLPPSVALQTLNFGAVSPMDLGARPLVSIWAGANDIRNSLRSGTPLATPSVAAGAADNIAGIISGLASNGLNDFLVFNLPDLGSTAELVNMPGALLGSASTSAFNMKLASNVADLRATGIKIIEVDIELLFAQVLANKEGFGFENVTQACIFNLGTCNPSTWLFFDGIHPTAAGHAAIEQRVRASIAAVPLPAGAPLLIFAMFGLGAVALRR